MKHLLLFINFLFLSISLTAQEESRQLDSFNELRANGDVVVELMTGKSNSAMVSVTSGDQSDVLTTVENGILRIKWKKNVDSSNRTAKVKLYHSNLNTIVANAGAKINSTEVITKDAFNVDASSGSKINVAVDCSSLEVECSSGAGITISGKATSQQVEASSGGSYKATDLITDTTNIEVSSGASAKVHATKNLNAEASTGGSVKYAGNPANKEIEENFYSGGSVKASN